MGYFCLDYARFGLPKCVFTILNKTLWVTSNIILFSTLAPLPSTSKTKSKDILCFRSTKFIIVAWNIDHIVKVSMDSYHYYKGLNGVDNNNKNIVSMVSGAQCADTNWFPRHPDIKNAMMTTWYRNILHITDPSWPVHRWFSTQKGPVMQCFHVSCVFSPKNWTNNRVFVGGLERHNSWTIDVSFSGWRNWWTNTRLTGNLRRHHGHWRRRHEMRGCDVFPQEEVFSVEAWA